MRLVGSDKALKEVSVGGGVIPRQKDGTFHVSGATASILRKSGDFAVAGVTFRNARGYVCADCKFVGLFPKCKCGSTNTTPDDEIQE
jgi:hypothetical protein